jgi:phage tail-like protein
MNLSDLPQEVLLRLDVLGLEPLKRFQFAIGIEGAIAGSRFIAGFREVTGITLVTDVRAVRESGYRGEHTFPRKTPSQSLTLLKGLDFSRYLWNWYQEVLRWTKGRPDYRRNLSIYQISHIHANAGDMPFEVWRWDIAHAWPSEWRGPDLNSMTQEIALESVVLRHAGLSEAEGIFSGKAGQVLGALT